MRLSIIVPFHRGKHFLEDCFESIRDQGLSSFETVLVLDHVEEDLTELLDNFQDLNIKQVELNEPIVRKKYKSTDDNKEDILAKYSGVAAARNAGLSAAEGDYVYFLDSDDYIMSGTLPFLIKEATEQMADFTFGKRATSWFSRKTYIASLLEKEASDVVEEQEKEGEIESEEKLLRRDVQVQRLLEEFSTKEQGESQDKTRRKAEAYYSLYKSRNGLRNVSILGILFNRNFLRQHDFQFNEDYTFFSDVCFVVKALKLAKDTSFVEEAVYIVRKHNDPIYYPSLNQIKDNERFDEFIQAYKEARSLTLENTALRKLTEQKLISYMANTYGPKLRRSENRAWRKERFEMIRQCMKEVDPQRMKELRGYPKRIVKALLHGSVRKAILEVNFYLGKKKAKKIFKNRRVFAYYLYHKFFVNMPIKENYVICESFFGKNYSDSPKYIYEYLCKNYPGKYRFVWIINKKTKIPFNPIKVKRFSIRYVYYLARSKYFIFNSRQPDWMKKREGSVFLQTWHGTPLKRLVFDQEEVMGAYPLYKAQVYKQSRMWDYLVSANYFSTGAFRSAFRYDKEILEYGYPRNDILHAPNKEEIAAQIRKKLQVPEGKKTILYAPTWRDDEYYGRGEYKFALKLDLQMMKRELGSDYVVLLRTHYFIADAIDLSEFGGFAINVCKYDDISELYLISDILITDYSSVFFDYANLKRPILFFTYDLDKYRDMLRGFYLDIEKEVPGPLLFTTGEVVEAIKNIDEIKDEYKEKYEDFYERFCGLEDGKASENIAKVVFKDL